MRIGDKSTRHTYIKSFIEEGKLSSQDELMEKLRDAGFRATQGTVSKDLTELGIIKNAEGFYVLSENDEKIKQELFLNSSIRNHILDFQRTPAHPILINTSYNMAKPIGTLLKRKFPHDIIGFLTEEDFLVIYPRGKESRETIIGFIDSQKR